ncbi:MAG: hypothetical protein ACRC0Y_10845 [Fusobacteriaceae bacterium]
MNRNNDFLLGGAKKTEQNSRLSESKRFIRNVLNSLKENHYDVQTTIKIIENEIKEKKGLQRLVYSQLTTEVYSINGELESERINQNISRLLDHVTSNCQTDDCQNIIIKFYDHYQLANFQVSKVNKEIEDKIRTESQELNDEIKKVKSSSEKAIEKYENMEKQNITILGIFAAIILSFVGSFVFSTSVLSNLHSTNIFKLVFMSSIIGIVFINMIHLLLSFIMKLNNHNETKFFELKKFNIFFIVLMILVVILYSFKNIILPIILYFLIK